MTARTPPGLQSFDGQVKQGEQEILHARDSVGQNSGATQWCPRPRFSDRIRNSRPTGVNAPQMAPGGRKRRSRRSHRSHGIPTGSSWHAPPVVRRQR